MIAAISEGGSGYGLMNYLVGPGRANEHENPHLVAGSDVIMRRWGAWDELSPAQGYEIARFVDQFMTETGVKPTGSRRAFNRDSNKREVIKESVPNHIWHCSLSLKPEEAAQGDERWRMIANDFMDEMGFTGKDGKAPCRWVAVHHGSAKNGGDHIHIMANIVREDGTRWNRWQDQPRAMRATNRIEHKYGLYVVEAREHTRGARADSAADLRAANRQGHKRTNREILEQRVRAAAVASTSEHDFLIRLRELGVKALPRFAKGTQDVVVGYRVGLHAKAGQRTQWYAGGKLARDLSLPRLRWPDTPVSAQQAVDAWRQAWRGMPPTQVSSRAEMAARVQALDTYAQALRGIDVTDPVALSDATRDVAGLLSAHALAATDPRAIEMLTRAARTAGRACQTHQRPAPAAGASEAVSLGARLALSAVINKHADPVVLVAQALALVEALADCYIAARQARTAAEMLASSRAALEAISTPTTVRDIEQLRAEAAYQALAGTAGEVQTGHHPAAATHSEPVESVRQRELVTAGAQTSAAASSGGQGAHGMSETQIERIRNVVALAMPAGGTPRRPAPPPPQRVTSSPDSRGQADTTQAATAGQDAISGRDIERVRRIYQNALSPTPPTAPARQRATGTPEQAPPRQHDPARRQGRRQ
jgi:relaxase/mobilization nuclease family protein